MTRKRRKKLLMSKGVSRNAAEEFNRIIDIGDPSIKAVAGYGAVTPIMRNKAQKIVVDIADKLKELKRLRTP